MGEVPAEGPVAMTMTWAYRQPVEVLSIVHIRDWHDPTDISQRAHLRQFGAHCVRHTPGAEFAFAGTDPDRPVTIINSGGLNDFVGTELEAVLVSLAAERTRIGLLGVWTEAKIMFLAYDLRTRFPDFELAVCSALTASSSRYHHYMALDQLQRLLGVNVFASIGEFTQFLAGNEAAMPLLTPKHSDLPKLSFADELTVAENDCQLLRYLFRDCREVHLRVLDGGYSGNVVLGSESVDLQGHNQVAHVVKIGPQGAIGQERTAFEQVEAVLGNNAPSITKFADLGGRGAIKYRYAAMGGGFSRTFQKLYMLGLDQTAVDRCLETVFVEQLGRLYMAATREKTNLLDYYWFSADRAESVGSRVEAILKMPATSDVLALPGGQQFPNPYWFYERELEEVHALALGSAYFSFVHGDLNGANIIIDGQDNVWLIDFFHTHRGHVLKDLIKLENDLLYIFTPLNDEGDLAEALQLTDALLQVEDLGQPLPELVEIGLKRPALQRAYLTIQRLRSFYPGLIKADLDPLQLFIGQLRYAAHTLSFEESSDYQKQWALYAAGHLGREIASRLRKQGDLETDGQNAMLLDEGKLGLTLLPGRPFADRR